MKVHKESTGLLVSFFSLILAICLSIVYFLGVGIALYISATVLFVLFLLTVNFFRCPKRISEHKGVRGAVVAPADGKIVCIEEVEENQILKRRCMKVSIFMSVFNVHANWFPCEGVVKQVSHQNGRFMAAYLPKSSTDNERSAVLITTPEGHDVLARQIAGALARRIVTYAEPGDQCKLDQHMGFIKFGSRVDVYLPLGTDVLVELDQLTVGNETLLAVLK